MLRILLDQRLCFPYCGATENEWNWIIHLFENLTIWIFNFSFEKWEKEKRKKNEEKIKKQQKPNQDFLTFFNHVNF